MSNTVIVTAKRTSESGNEETHTFRLNNFFGELPEAIEYCREDPKDDFNFGCLIDNGVQWSAEEEKPKKWYVKVLGSEDELCLFIPNALDVYEFNPGEWHLVRISDVSFWFVYYAERRIF